MPATMTHQMFALNIIDTLKNEYPLLLEKKHILMLATQGPDPFFFYRTLPWQHAKDTKRIRMHGSILHHQTPAINLTKLYTSAKTMNDDDVFAYMIGAVMHYILDKYVHPYVFSTSGFSEDGSLGHPYEVYHSHMETLMDVALRHHKKIQKSDLHPAKKIQLKRELLLKIDHLYVNAYPDLVKPKDYYKAAKDMVRLYRFVYDSFGFKRKLFALLMGKTSHAYAISHPPTLKGEELLDVLNMSKNEWYHTETNQASQDDVLMLMEKAKKDMIKMIHSMMKGDIDFQVWTQDINYDGLSSTGTHTYQTDVFPLWRKSQ